MIRTIEFEGLSCLLLDFVDTGKGLLYLRMVGEEPTVNAIWARLSAREYREQKHNSEVKILTTGSGYPQYVAAQKFRYTTVRKRLPSSLIDLAMIHPQLSVAEDSNRGFKILSYDDDIPQGFFARLNRCLSLPIKPEWASWLWELGQQEHQFTTQRDIEVKEGTKTVIKQVIEPVTGTPITVKDSLGTVRCFQVKTDPKFRDCWLQIIRQQLGLEITLVPNHPDQPTLCLNGSWGALQINDAWQLQHHQITKLAAQSLDDLVTRARHRLGLNLVVGDVGGPPC